MERFIQQSILSGCKPQTLQRAWGPRFRTTPWIPLTRWENTAIRSCFEVERWRFKDKIKCKIKKLSHSKRWKSSWLMANQTVNSLLQLVNLFCPEIGSWQKTLPCVILLSFLPASGSHRLSAVYQTIFWREKTPHKGRKVHKWITNFKCNYLCSLPYCSQESLLKDILWRSPGSPGPFVPESGC